MLRIFWNTFWFKHSWNLIKKIWVHFDSHFIQLFLGLDYVLHILFCWEWCLESKSSKIQDVGGPKIKIAQNGLKQTFERFEIWWNFWNPKTFVSGHQQQSKQQ